MSAPDPFDELARRKLAEREHPFDESAWADLQPALDAQRGRDHRRILLWLPLALAIVGLAWWLIPTQGPSSVAIPPTDDSAFAEGKNNGALATTPTSPTTQEKDRAASAPHTVAPEQEVITMESAQSKRIAAPVAVPRMHSQSAHAHRTQEVEQGSAPSTTASTNPQTSEPLHEAVLITPDTLTSLQRTVGTPDPRAALPQATPLSEFIDSASTPGIAQRLASDQAEAHAIPAGAKDSTAQAIALTPTPVQSHIMVECGRPAQQLEVGIWTGPFLTYTGYTGHRTMDWDATIRGTHTMAYGADLMRQGTQFGFGLGLYYTTYAEHLEAQALSEEHRTRITNYHLTPIDTTILIIDGPVWINGQLYHATHLLDTVIQVLVGTTDERTTTLIRRNALERRNRSSYLEIPLLFEAHAQRGAWTFALRGGPTIGILQGLRGALPSNTGYTKLSDETFQHMVLGYTVQARVNHQLGPAWSIGLGPALRGQLTNSIDSNGLNRRSHAAGVVIGLSYRLQ